MNDTSWRLGSSSNPVNRTYDMLRRHLNRQLIAYLRGHALAGDGPYRVLEAGSGTGFATSLLGQYPNTCLSLALDHDLRALNEGGQRDPGFCGTAGDLLSLPFASGAFDLVWNSSTVEHLDRTGDALVEMARVTRSGGYVFTGTPFAQGPLGFQRGIAHTAAGVWIGRVYSIPQLTALVREAGLHPRDTLLYFFRFFVGVLAQKP